MKNKALLLIPLMLIMILSACFLPGYHDDTGEAVSVSSVSVAPDTLNLAAGWSYQLTAEVLPADADNKNISWSSANNAVATVAADGTVAAVSAGTVNITAASEDGNIQDVCTVTVAASGDLFISTWDMSLTAATSLTIPSASPGSFNFTINWGDGSPVELFISGIPLQPIQHDFPSSAEYTVTIAGTFNTFGFSSLSEDNEDNLTDINQWGTVRMHNNGSVFRGCSNLVSFSAADSPDLSAQTSLISMFCSAENFNGDISGWNTSNVTSMSSMFESAAAFNQDISGWDMSGVTSIGLMFCEATSFNQDISGWDTSSVTNMAGVFRETDAFNPTVLNWDTSSVTNMNYMFYHTTGLNPDISGWDTSSVTNMGGMFYYAYDFSQDISGWDTSSVVNMQHMFEGADSFNQDISGWDTSAVTDMSYMFRDADLFNQDISGWDTSAVTDIWGMFCGTKAFNQDISGWVISNITNMNYLFASTEAFNQDISGWDVSAVTAMACMFDGAEVFNQDISGWNTSNVVDMSYMFRDTVAFNQDISAWDTSKVGNMISMFYYASAYTNGGNPEGLEDWTVQSGCTTTGMFTGCPLNPQPSWY